jgi:hypothetical protein
MLGMVHPRLRTAALSAELLNTRGQTVEVLIGSAIEASRLDCMPDDKEAIQYLRLRSELLAPRSQSGALVALELAPIVGEIPADDLAREIESLPAHRLLEQNREYSVYLAEAGGRRFLPHRRCAEAAPKIWTQGTGYSVAFPVSPAVFHRMGPSLELGRSFIRREYQKQFAPLLLLWKGISAYVCRRPEYSTLIGAVSVSNQYSPASREVTRVTSRSRPEPIKPPDDSGLAACGLGAR